MDPTTASPTHKHAYAKPLFAWAYKKLSRLKIIQLEIIDKGETPPPAGVMNRTNRPHRRHKSDKWLFADDDGLNLASFRANTKYNKYKYWREIVAQAQHPQQWNSEIYCIEW